MVERSQNRSSVLAVTGSTFANRLDQRQEAIFQDLLEDRVAESASSVARVEFRNATGVHVEGIEKRKHDSSLDRTAILDPKVIGVGVHAPHRGPYRDAEQTRGQPGEHERAQARREERHGHAAQIDEESRGATRQSQGLARAEYARQMSKSGQHMVRDRPEHEHCRSLDGPMPEQLDDARAILLAVRQAVQQIDGDENPFCQEQTSHPVSD